MTRFTWGLSDWGRNPRLTVRLKPGDVDAVATLERSQEVLSGTQRMLHRAILALEPPQLDARTLRAASRFFLTPAAGPSAHELMVLRNSIGMVFNGLAGDLTFKVGTDVGKGRMRDPAGEVTARKSVPEVHKIYHNRLSRFDRERTYGAIKVDVRVLHSALGPKTLIHEASHKYAGTIDYCMFDRCGQPDGGPFTERKEALKKADSYAWFVLALAVGSESRAGFDATVGL